MYFLIYKAHPSEGTTAAEKYGTASVACWINVTDEEMARATAEKMIREHGWEIDSLDEQYPMTREQAERSEGLEYYEQALIDTEVLVFFTAPVGAPEE